MPPLDDSPNARINASIIILTKNGEQYLYSLLAALYCQTGIESAEVIVIDSGSMDTTLRIVSEFPKAKLVEIPAHEFGHGKTRNLGAQLARGEYLVFLPQDATPIGSEWLSSLLQPFAEAEVAGVFGRQVARVDASPMERFFLDYTYSSEYALKRIQAGESGSLVRCFFSTVGGAIRASVWALHPFRDDIIMSEDQAWALDVMHAGHAVAYQPSAEVWHSHHYGVADIFRRNFDSGFSVRQIFSGATGITALSGLGRLAAEAIYVVQHGRVKDWMFFIPYEFARHVGFLLGLYGHRLPRRVCRYCSKLTYFWDQHPRSQGVV
ncbi:MAG TPA: glycosyltransferase family 2 protein [Rhodocyclaceae bacterium]|nr:glycosyltransferase family 2 protein [Rhodocyclaceae bacterium]